MSLLVKRMIYLYIEFPLTIQSPSLHAHIVRTQCVNTQHSRTVDSSPYLSAAPLTCGTEPLASTLTYFFSLPPSLAHSFTSPNAHCPRHWISCITTPSHSFRSLSFFLLLCCLDRFECPNAECYSGFSPKTVAFLAFLFLWARVCLS